MIIQTANFIETEYDHDQNCGSGSTSEQGGNFKPRDCPSPEGVKPKMCIIYRGHGQISPWPFLFVQ